MAYIYDILLNLNTNLIEFYEWNDTDNIKYIRKTPLFKINQELMNDIINYEIELDNSFVENLKDKTSFYNNFDKDYDYVCLFSDGYFAIGAKFENNRITLLSRMQLDEEEEVLKITDRLNANNIIYKKIKKKENDNKKYFTRSELVLKEKLIKELHNLYKNKNIEELKYYYYEYFNIKKDNIDNIYKELLSSMNNTINEKHQYLYEIIMLSNNKSKIC